MLKYYTTTEKKRTADEVLGGLQAVLMPIKNEAGDSTARQASQD